MKKQIPSTVGKVALFFLCLTGVAAGAAHEGLMYEIVESSPGTRSQGWRGTLYDKDGLAVTTDPGVPVKTPVGLFGYVACVMPWQPCGTIPLSMLRGQDLDHAENVVMPQAWSYRIYVVNPGARTEIVRGELIRDGEIVKPEAKEIRTPMGVFVWQETVGGAGLHGWNPSPPRQGEGGGTRNRAVRTHFF